MKMFQTSDINVVKFCQHMISSRLPSELALESSLLNIDMFINVNSICKLLISLRACVN